MHAPVYHCWSLHRQILVTRRKILNFCYVPQYFLVAYSGYHHIKLDSADAMKTSFITPFGAYCYITMSFGLKNAGATFQRCM